MSHPRPRIDFHRIASEVGFRGDEGTSEALSLSGSAPRGRVSVVGSPRCQAGGQNHTLRLDIRLRAFGKVSHAYSHDVLIMPSSENVSGLLDSPVSATDAER